MRKSMSPLWWRDSNQTASGNPGAVQFLAINGIEYTKTKVRSPQTNGIFERFHKTILQEFYQVTFRKKIACTTKGGMVRMVGMFSRKRSAISAKRDK